MLKYRCPAAAYGYHCAGREAVKRVRYGRIVRIPLAEQDRRIFRPASPWPDPEAARIPLKRRLIPQVRAFAPAPPPFPFGRRAPAG